VDDNRRHAKNAFKRTSTRWNAVTPLQICNGIPWPKGKEKAKPSGIAAQVGNRMSLSNLVALRNIRSTVGMTISEVEAQCAIRAQERGEEWRVTAETVEAIEAGRYAPSPHQLLGLISVYRVSLAEMLERIGMGPDEQMADSQAVHGLSPDPPPN
jgi:hypothetical protein